MKKIMYFAAVAAVLSLASCAKETLNEDAGTESPVFTATISAGTKTTVVATSGKVAWETTDKITITDASAGSAIYKITSIDETSGKATFEVESGTLGQGPYTATYGTAPAMTQTYAATPCNLYMTAPETSTNSFTFTVQCGLMEINLTKTGESVKSIAVTGTPTAESETTYTLTCTDAVSIAAKKSFYIALPEGSFNKIVITDSEGKVCTLTAASGIALENNHIKPVTLDAGKLDFIPADALAGVFTVADPDDSPNNGNETKVHFSQGNLYYDGSNFNFEANQYDFRTYAGKYSCIDGTSSDNGTPTGHWGLFGWSTEDINYGMNNYGMKTSQYDFDYSGNFKDWGTAIDDKDTWRTLTTAEWQYLFSYDGSSFGGQNYDNDTRHGKYKYGVTVCGKANCVVLLPDNWNETIISLTNFATQTTYNESSTPKWSEMQAAGAVCLPAAGNRYGSSVYNVGYNGFYWSSIADNSNLANAYYVNFASDYVSPDDRVSRVRGYSVRLITECQ